MSSNQTVKKTCVCTCAPPLNKLFARVECNCTFAPCIFLRSTFPRHGAGGDGATGAADDAVEAVCACASDGAPAAFAAGDDVGTGAQHPTALTFTFNGYIEFSHRHVRGPAHCCSCT